MLARHADPIAAIATAPGRGGVGIVRISGKSLGPLVQALKARGNFVTLETNGTNPVPAAWGIDWITVSPKPDSDYVINCSANELKYVVDDNFSVDVIQADRVPLRHIYLQVESCKPESAARAVRIVTENPKLQLRVGIQLHKVLNVE